MACAARQHSDQVQCPRCNHTWDVNDPNPPECRDQIRVREISRAAHGGCNFCHRDFPGILWELKGEQCSMAARICGLCMEVLRAATR